MSLAGCDDLRDEARHLDGITEIVIVGPAGDDQLTIAFEGDEFDVAITFDGNGRDDTLRTSAGGGTWTITGTDSGSVGSVTFTDVRHLAATDGTASTFVVTDTGSLTGTVAGGDPAAATDVQRHHEFAAYTASGANTGSGTLVGVAFSYRGVMLLRAGTVIGWSRAPMATTTSPSPTRTGCSGSQDRVHDAGVHGPDREPDRGGGSHDNVTVSALIPLGTRVARDRGRGIVVSGAGIASTTGDVVLAAADTIPLADPSGLLGSLCWPGSRGRLPADDNGRRPGFRCDCRRGPHRARQGLRGDASPRR